MAALLLYSMRCQHCVNVLNTIQKNKALQSIIKLHDVNRQGIPHQLHGKIDCVPALITKDGNLMTGKEVKNWITSMIPDSNEMGSINFGGMAAGLQSIENPEENGEDFFELDSYGTSLAPPMTPELQRKIDMDVSDAYNQAQSK